MRARLAILAVLASLASAATLPAAADARNCRPVGSYRVTALGVSCTFAREASRRYFQTRRTPRGWRCVKRRTTLSCGRGSRRAFGAYRG